MDFTPAEAAACRALVALALAEDLGPAASPAGDLTSQATIPPAATGRADLVARTAGVLAGLPAATLVAAAVDPRLTLCMTVQDATRLTPGITIATLTGPLISLLAAERAVLNFIQRLSGVATLTRAYADAVTGTRAVVLDTRKTTPGWRLLEKYAVRAGGGANHRVGLYDAILIKDNHLAGLGGDVVGAVRAARAHAPPGTVVEVEVDTLPQLDAALTAGPDIVLLDNMTPDTLREAVIRRDRVAPGVRLEASGGVTLATIRAIARTGVDRISVGAITHSAPALDIGLDYRA